MFLGRLRRCKRSTQNRWTECRKYGCCNATRLFTPSEPYWPLQTRVNRYCCATNSSHFALVFMHAEEWRCQCLRRRQAAKIKGKVGYTQRHGLSDLRRLWCGDVWLLCLYEEVKELHEIVETCAENRTAGKLQGYTLLCPVIFVTFAKEKSYSLTPRKD